MTEKPTTDAKKTTQNRSSSRSKSRSKSQLQQRRDCDSLKNPYVNYLKEFKKSNSENSESEKELVRAASERWENMTETEKAPFMNTNGADKNKVQKKSKEKQDKPNEEKKKESTADRKKNPKRQAKKPMTRKCCSKCGHRHGSCVRESRYGWGRRRYLRDNRSFERDSDDTSRTRSRSRSGEGRIIIL